MPRFPVLAIRSGDERRDSTTGAHSHEWVALVGANGETMMTTETYPAGHGNAERARREIREAFAAAIDVGPRE